MTTPDEEEFFELVDGHFPRVDLVGKSANGFPRFLIAKSASGPRGVVEAQVVRDLIAPVRKAKQMQAVFDQGGRLVGICDPSDVQPIATEEPEAPAPEPKPASPAREVGAQIAKAHAREGELTPAGLALAVMHARQRQAQLARRPEFHRRMGKS